MKLYTKEEYKKIKQTILADKGKNHCPFCHIQTDDSDLVIGETQYWYVAHNKFPYGLRSDHLLVFPKRCVEFTKDLTPKEMAEFPEIEKFMTEFYKNHDDYWSMIRQRSHIKSVLHLHYHYFPGDIRSHDIEKIFQRQKIESNI